MHRLSLKIKKKHPQPPPNFTGAYKKTCIKIRRISYLFIILGIQTKGGIVLYGRCKLCLCLRKNLLQEKGPHQTRGIVWQSCTIVSFVERPLQTKPR